MMRILHISDTHSRHGEMENLSEADIIIHSGDITENGTVEEILDFIEWFESLDYRYKVFIQGNHDIELYGSKIEGLAENTFYLDNSLVNIGGLNIYGVYLGSFNNIPDNTDIIVTHVPPLGILDGTDRSYGDHELLNRVFEIKPKLHLFGHIHESPGMECIDGIIFSNATSMGVYNVFDV